MVRFVDNLYVTDGISSKISRIKWKTMAGAGMLNVYFVTLALSDNDLFDIYSATVFKQRALRKSNLIILGVAEGYVEATELVKIMIDDCIRATGQTDNIRAYYEEYVNKNIL